jgi:hypothetical protein
MFYLKNLFPGGIRIRDAMSTAPRRQGNFDHYSLVYFCAQQKQEMSTTLESFFCMFGITKINFMFLVHFKSS